VFSKVIIYFICVVKILKRSEQERENGKRNNTEN
jgi:hypothetical protein